MVARMTQVMGTTVAVALVVTALWGWGQAGRIADNAHRSESVLWAVRSAAIAAGAAAQVLIITFAAGAVYSRRGWDEIFRLLAGLLCTVATLAAIALALSGQ